jgi:hypothetical protein
MMFTGAVFLYKDKQDAPKWGWRLESIHMKAQTQNSVKWNNSDDVIYQISAVYYYSCTIKP